MAPLKPVSVVLLNLLNPDPYRVFRDEYFPFLLGYLRHLGVPATRLFVGGRPGAQEGGVSGLVYDVLPEDLDAVSTWLGARQPTHVLLNERLTQRAYESLKCALPGTSFRLVEAMGPEDLRPCVTQWLQLPWPEGQSPHVEAWLTPDYSGEALGAAAHQSRPHVHLFAGPECAYRRSISKNPYYRDVDLSATESPVGCAFCGTGDKLASYWLPPDPLALAAPQLQRAYATCNRDVCDWTFRVRGSAMAGLLPGLVRLLKELDAPPSRFLLSLRIDEFLAARSSFEEALPLLRAGGHRIELWNMGLENLSPVENERLNKGIELGVVRQAVPLLKQYGEKFPGTFRFSEFGFILFTPWTTLADLKANLDAIEELQLTSLDHFLSSTLLLLPGRAVTELARKDGLLAEESDIQGLNRACLVWWNSTLIPWKFKHPEVAAIHQVMLCICPLEGMPTNDPWYVQVQQWAQRVFPEGISRTQVLRALVEAAGRNGGADALGVMLEAERHAQPKPAGPGRAGSVVDPGRWKSLLSVLQGTPKPALLERGGWRLEGWSRQSGDEGEALELTFVFKGVRVVAVVAPAGRGGGLARGRVWKVWYKEPKGELAADVQLALRRVLVLAEQFLRA